MGTAGVAPDPAAAERARRVLEGEPPPPIDGSEAPPPAPEIAPPPGLNADGLVALLESATLIVVPLIQKLRKRELPEDFLERVAFTEPEKAALRGASELALPAINQFLALNPQAGLASFALVAGGIIWSKVQACDRGRVDVDRRGSEVREEHPRTGSVPGAIELERPAAASPRHGESVAEFLRRTSANAG